MTIGGEAVVVTGVGPITPIGFGKEVYWENLVQGRSSFKRIAFPNRDMSQYRCQIAAPVEGFDFHLLVEQDPVQVIIDHEVLPREQPHALGKQLDSQPKTPVE